ncbi:MAG: peptidoglycan-binding protein [Candidatus Pacebacteria bacterium]|nr:peptidoglycan-binding protein [Candidatus Paceibacterota bacterium]
MQINRKKIIFAVLIGFVLFLIAGYFFILSNQEQEDAIDSTQNLFPFGEVTPGDSRPDIDSQGTIGDENNDIQDSGDPDDFEETPDGPRLRKISDFPTGGFTPIIRIEEQEVSDIEIDNDGNTLQTTRTVEVKNQFVRYSAIEDATVHETKVEPNFLDSEIIVDNFIPNAEIAHFNNDGTQVLFQYWNNEERTPESYLAEITPLVFEIPSCPIDFSPIEIGLDEARVIGIHTFLNQNPQTRVAATGLNSPGNESSLVTESTITAIKNFQSLYQLDIDGELGPATREVMTSLCDEQEEVRARAEFEAQERKHTISGFFLTQGITSAAMSPVGNELFYIQEGRDGVSGIKRNLENGSDETIFESPFTEWLSSWNNPDSIELSTKPSYLAEGFSYQLDPLTGRYFKSLPERDGLTVLPSPDNRKLLVMEAEENTIKLSVHTRSSNRTRPLNIQTFVEKCTWSPDSRDLYCLVPNALSYGNEYPDIWYQGIESYTDSLWKINTRTFEEEVLSDFINDYGVDIDIEGIKVDPEEEYLYFLDKKTEELWSYRLN